MQEWTQILFTGLGVGVVYGLVGAGYVVVHRMTGMVNFAQGDLAVLGAFGAVVASGVLPPLLAIVVGGLVGAVGGLLLYGLAIHPLRGQGLLVQTIVTLGAGIVIRSVLQLVFGTRPYQFDPITSGPSLRLLGANLERQYLWLLLLAAVMYVALRWFFDRTMTGLALSACAVNRHAAGIVGINVVVMATIAFGVSGVISGVAGSAQVPVAFATVGSGLALGLKGFIAAILGGFDKIGLAIVGGVLIGTVEAMSATMISTLYSETIVLGLLLVLLVLRPAGLTRLTVSTRV